VTLSRHTARTPTTPCRVCAIPAVLPGGVPVDHVPRFGARPLRSTAITAASSLLLVSPPLSSASILSALVFTLAPFLLPSLVRFACSVQRAWTSFTPLKRRTLRNQYLGLLLRLSQERVQLLVLVPPKRLSTLHQWFTCARLSSPYMTGLNPAFSVTFTTNVLKHQQLTVVCSLFL
jgi:hypothetical protein